MPQSTLAPAHPNPDAQWTALRHWTGAELSALELRVSAAIEQWCRDWLVREDFWAEPSLRARAVRLASSRPADAQVVLPVGPAVPGGTSAPQAWIGFPGASGGSRPPSVAQLALGVVFGAAAKARADSLALQSATAALDDLAQVLCTMIGQPPASSPFADAASPAALPDCVQGAWDGGVQVSLPTRCGFAIYLNGAAVAKLAHVGDVKLAAGRSGNLTPVQDATASAKLALQVRLNSVELTFGQLQSLNLGDVIVLPHPITEPLDVIASNDARLCKAYLGRSEGRRAILAVRSPPAGEGPPAQ
jgi:hypothetical protein